MDVNFQSLAFMNSAISKQWLGELDLNDWTDLEHQLWKELKENELQDKKILVGFSGGVDSLALLWSLHRVKKAGVEACYVHHGVGDNQPYRDAAESFCKKFCEEKSIPFHSRKNTGPVLKSEADLRDFRHRSLEEVRLQTSSNLLALAHHREDLLETRLLRLIRGTGSQGIVAMRILQAPLFRPFLKTSKKDLQEYLEKFSLQAFEDPSNQDLNPFRNWLRQEWLVALEKRQEGSVNSLGRSLEILADSLEEKGLPEGIFQDNFMSRPHYLALSKTQQKQALAQYMLRQGAQDFSQSHLEEIQKRLDISQKEFIFKVGGIDWEINAQQIRVQKSK
ncbi:tRNA lysidine(34) synthetase TilS [Bdellovibrio sp. HCB337]|uniref:tRNA lysidine(34) synthetase TilS n=1 Tax=Bdellovibrio sp. HCB337 TaxID=3394358 RepID=UPI0039A54CA1